MEMQKQECCILRQKNRADSQITIDEEFNVPDAREDIGRMIQKRGRIKLHKVKVSEDRVHLYGELVFELLYVTDDDTGGISSLTGQLPIEETIRLADIRETDNIHLDWDVEDLAVRLVHPRKLNVQAMISFSVLIKEQKTLVLPVEVCEKEHMSVRMQQERILESCVHRKESIRLQEEIPLPANRQDVERILWQDVQVRGMKLRCYEGEIQYKGELSVFLLYAGNDLSSPPEWIEENVSIAGAIECERCKPDMLPNIDYRLVQGQISVKPDANGKERMLTAEAELELELRLEQEKQYTLVMDAYNPAMECTPLYKEETVENLLIKNEAKCRISDHISTGAAQGKILQICHSDGTVRVDECRIVPRGLEIEGILQVHSLYIVSDDAMPFYATEAVLPFQQLIEVPGIHENIRYELSTKLEQLSTTMADSHEIEVRAVLNCCALVLGRQTMPILQDIKEKPIDPVKMRDCPGIVCLRVQPQDTLWDLAKSYYTTVEDICKLNALEGDMRVGQQLILVKKVQN